MTGQEIKVKSVRSRMTGQEWQVKSDRWKCLESWNIFHLFSLSYWYLTNLADLECFAFLFFVIFHQFLHMKLRILFCRLECVRSELSCKRFNRFVLTSSPVDKTRYYHLLYLFIYQICCCLLLADILSQDLVGCSSCLVMAAQGSVPTVSIQLLRLVRLRRRRKYKFCGLLRLLALDVLSLLLQS